jgi:hypothetical protein
MVLGARRPQTLAGLCCLVSSLKMKHEKYSPDYQNVRRKSEINSCELLGF